MKSMTFIAACMTVIVPVIAVSLIAAGTADEPTMPASGTGAHYDTKTDTGTGFQYDIEKAAFELEKSYQDLTSVNTISDMESQAAQYATASVMLPEPMTVLILGLGSGSFILKR